jgi:pyruvate/2-oxoglutarate dehydrogenase complex dihydrolipoamide dehydrogenase (E3) component
MILILEYGITSNEFFDEMSEVPKRVAVVGAGYIAIELAGVLHGLGNAINKIYFTKNLNYISNCIQ